MKVAVANLSQVYNLGAERIAHYHEALGDQVFLWRGSRPGQEFPLLYLWERKPDKLYLSVIFTWELPHCARVANLARSLGVEVEIGGPAATVMTDWVHQQTGIRPHTGLDTRFENLPGDFEATFTSRGCPNRCAWCLVSQLEGNHITEYPDFPLSPFISDSNILASSFEHQVRVVDRLKPLGPVDINSGFDVRRFTPEHFDLYRRLDLKFWRFAFDTLSVEEDVERSLGILRRGGVRNHRVIIVYILAGFGKDTPETARYRAHRVIGLEGSPYIMAYRPLDSLNRTHVPEGWSREDMERLVTYFNVPRVWRSVSFERFSRTYKADAQGA